MLYPLCLLLFNCVIWAGLGLSAGILVAGIVKKGGHRSLNWYYGCFFLPPFVLLYGLLGRLTFPIYAWRNLPQIHVYDNHLSFIFVTALIGYRLYTLRKESSDTCARRYLFVLEIAATALLYHFCSNLNYIVLAVSSHEFLSTIMPLIYSGGVVLIFCFYWLGCFFKKKFDAKRLGKQWLDYSKCAVYRDCIPARRFRCEKLL